MACNNCGKMHGGICILCPTCYKHHPPPCWFTVQQQPPFPAFGGQQHPLPAFCGQQQPFWSFGIQPAYPFAFGGWQTGGLPIESFVGGAGGRGGRGGSHGRSRGRGRDRGEGRSGSRAANGSQQEHPASEAPTKGSEGVAAGSGRRAKTAKQRKAKKLAARMAKKARREVADRPIDFDVGNALAGAPTAKSSPPKNNLRVSKLKFAGLEAEVSKFSEEGLIEDVRVNPGSLELEQPSQRMVIDDMAWALTYHACNRLQLDLVTRAPGRDISMIELAIEEGLFAEEMENRHAPVEDEAESDGTLSGQSYTE